MARKPTTAPSNADKAAVDKPTAEPAAATVHDGGQAKSKAASTVDVTAPRPRRRAGMAFGTEPVTIDPETIGGDAWKAIQDDPVLVIRPTPEDEA